MVAAVRPAIAGVITQNEMKAFFLEHEIDSNAALKSGIETKSWSAKDRKKTVMDSILRGKFSHRSH